MGLRDNPQYEKVRDDLLRDTKDGPWNPSKGNLELYEGGGERQSQSIKQVTDMLVENNMVRMEKSHWARGGRITASRLNHPGKSPLCDAEAQRQRPYGLRDHSSTSS